LHRKHAQQMQSPRVVGLLCQHVPVAFLGLSQTSGLVMRQRNFKGHVFWHRC
jgi:hypothetical protein